MIDRRCYRLIATCFVAGASWSLGQGATTTDRPIALDHIGEVLSAFASSSPSLCYEGGGEAMRGVDAPALSDVVVTESSVVLRVEYDALGYARVLTEHGDGVTFSVYDGLSSVAVGEGDVLSAGTTIGQSGAGHPYSYRSGRSLPCAILVGEPAGGSDLRVWLEEGQDDGPPSVLTVRLDGLYIGELNASNGFSIAVENVRRGAHYIHVGCGDPCAIGSHIWVEFGQERSHLKVTTRRYAYGKISSD